MANNIIDHAGKSRMQAGDLEPGVLFTIPGESPADSEDPPSIFMATTIHLKGFLVAVSLHTGAMSNLPHDKGVELIEHTITIHPGKRS